jgi:hypothetical protein
MHRIGTLEHYLVNGEKQDASCFGLLRESGD